MKFKIIIEVEYSDLNGRTEDETRIDLERELDRHIQDGLLLYDLEVDQYSAWVEVND